MDVNSTAWEQYCEAEDRETTAIEEWLNHNLYVEGLKESANYLVQNYHMTFSAAVEMIAEFEMNLQDQEAE